MEIYKTFIVVLSIAVLGCTSQRKQAHQAEPSVSLERLKKLPSRLAKLQRGMSSERVWEQLGLASGKFGGPGGGPPSHYREEFLLPHGYVLTLVFDYSKGDFWKRTGGIFLYGGCYIIGNKGDTERKVIITDDATEVIACLRVVKVPSAQASVNAKLQIALQGSKVEKKRINRALELMRPETAGTHSTLSQ